MRNKRDDKKENILRKRPKYKCLPVEGMQKFADPTFLHIRSLQNTAITVVVLIAVGAHPI